ncbi:MAG TPA: VOC family protein [Steroidobacteraceae bacterium]|nr:VOC family protein [Steroidobacteraceae bacterium]
MTNAQNPFVWYEFMSSDVAAAKTFYGKVVGWKFEDVPVSGMTYTLLRAGDRQIGGMMAMPQHLRDAGLKPYWAAHIGVYDVDAAAAKVRQLGGKVHREPTDIPNVGRFAAVSDRQGANFLMFKPSQPGERVFSRAPGDVGWHELHTTDWANAFEFYSAMFGWARADPFDMGPMGIYQLFTIGGTQVGGMFNSPAAKQGCFWLYYFNVEDIGAAAGCISDNGGKIMHGPQQVPGGGWIVQASDPEGAAFALLAPR